MAVDPNIANRFLERGFFKPDEVKELEFVDLQHYFLDDEKQAFGDFTDPEVLAKFKSSEAGMTQIAMIKESLGGVELTQGQLDELLIQAQILQYAGHVYPQHVAMYYSDMEGMVLGEVEQPAPKVQSPEDTQKETVSSDVAGPVYEPVDSDYLSEVIVNKLADEGLVYRPELENAIRDAVVIYADVIQNAGYEMNVEAFSKDLVFFYKFLDENEDEVLDWPNVIARKSDDEILGFYRDTDVIRKEPADNAGVGGLIHEIAQDAIERGADYERVVISAKDLQALIDEEYGVEEGFNDAAGHDPDSEAVFESSARDMSSDDPSGDSSLEADDPALEKEGTDVAVLYNM